MIITPEQFWTEYKAHLRKKFQEPDANEAYYSDFQWTPRAIEAAERTINTLEKDLKLTHQYFRLDLMAHERHEPFHNWTVRVAFEHENRDTWPDELCKLCHIVADLRVLISYWNFKDDGSVEPELGKCLDRVKYQLGRNTVGKWLFIFGPRCYSFGKQYPYVAYTCSGTKPLQLRDGSDLLNPDDFFKCSKP